jgi:SAM-dependent methyltransferase
MHKESFQLMEYFIEKYLDKNREIQIIDIGSYDVNGSYKSLLTKNNWKYTGLDIVEGPNVDIVSKSKYLFGVDRKFDVVVSGNCLEHVEAPWLWVKEVEKIINTGGLVCVITPFSIGEHRYPVDCWRILPDGYKYLFETVADFTVIESFINNNPIQKIRFFNSRPNLMWLYRLLPEKIKKYFNYIIYPIQDTVLIARKN